MLLLLIFWKITLRIAGIVLAGGLSSRMGQDKAQLQLAKQTLLSRAVSLLENVNLKQIFVSGQYPEYASIPDMYPQFGPLGGVHACVEQLYGSFDALFIVPVDMPLLSAVDCDLLLNKFLQHPQGVFYQEVTFPMILPLNHQLKEYLGEALVSPHKIQRSLYRLLKTLKIQPVNYPQQHNFRFQNSNTPQEWQACLQMHAVLYQRK